MVKFNCDYCGKETEKATGHYNRAERLGNNHYCNRICAGFGRRDNKTVEQKKKEKSEYDKVYRSKNFEKKRIYQKDYFKKDYAANPEKYRQRRKEIYPKHLEYLRLPRWVKYKQQYDKIYRAKKIYGEELYEAALVLVELEKELDSKQIKFDYGITQNKSTQKRKRSWQRLQRPSRQKN